MGQLPVIEPPMAGTDAGDRRRRLPSPAEPPRRRCIATGAVGPRAAMLRFVVGPDDVIVPDVDGRLPGRGLWLKSSRDAVNAAVARGLFAKAAGRRVSVPDDLALRVERLLVRRGLDLVGLARRAGQAAAGFDQVRTWLAAGKGGLLLAAADGSSGGRAKIHGLAPQLPLIELFSAAELGGALGRQRAVHVVVASGRLAERLAAAAMRLREFRRTPATAGADPAPSIEAEHGMG